MSASQAGAEAAPVPSKDCEHVIHEWPITGPWVDYTCARCGHNWRLTWGQAMGHLLAGEQRS